jgi:hypothetical protein
MHFERFTKSAPCVCALLICCLLGCREEAIRVSNLPPLLGFGDTTAVLPAGFTLPLPLLATTSPREDVQITYRLEASPEQRRAFAERPDSVITLKAGTLETTLAFTTVAPLPGSVQGTFVRVILDSTDAVRLSDRNTVSLYFGFRNEVDLSIWAPNNGFPQLYGYTSFSEAPAPTEGGGPQAGEHFTYAYVSTQSPETIGFRAPNPGDGTNAFNMVRIYADEDVTAGSARIALPEVLRFQPAFPGAGNGSVTVIPQQVELIRTRSSGRDPFTIGISGSGTYNETTGVISLSVIFDETDIGGPQRVVRNYLYESRRR